MYVVSLQSPFMMTSGDFSDVLMFASSDFNSQLVWNLHTLNLFAWNICVATALCYKTS